MILGSCRASGLLAFVPRLVQAPLSHGKGSSFATILLLLFAAHAFCDYPGQGQFLSEAKNRHINTDGCWWRAMLAHCLIHSGLVLLITGSLWLALPELVIHYATDCAKCEDWISSDTDQAIHYGCKVVWALAVVLL